MTSGRSAANFVSMIDDRTRRVAHFTPRRGWVDRPGRPVETIPCLSPSAAVDVVIDADILEIFNGGVYGAWRLIC